MSFDPRDKKGRDRWLRDFREEADAWWAEQVRRQAARDRVLWWLWLVQWACLVVALSSLAAKFWVGR